MRRSGGGRPRLRRGSPIYKLLEHTAEIRIRIYGRTLKALFQNAVLALTDTLADAKKIKPSRSLRLKITAEDRELLLVRLLREVLFLFDTRHFLVRRLEITDWRDTMIQGKFWGERFSPKRHILKTEIKAVTYHGLKVGKRGGRWYAEVVLDV